MPVRSVALLSLHTSPVAQPGVGDGGGMNIYVRSLASALARAGVACDVYTRAEHPGQPPVVTVEPNFRVINVPAGPLSSVPKESLPGLGQRRRVQGDDGHAPYGHGQRAYRRCREPL